MDSFKEFLLSNDTDSIYSITSDVVALVLSLVFLWKIFEKAGEKGWEALIPVYNIFNIKKLIEIIYNTYILFKIAWKEKYFWILCLFVFTMFFGALLMGINPSNLVLGGFGDIIIIGSCVGMLVIYFSLLSKICNSFNKGGLFMVGLIFLNIIFLGILAFDKSKYVGPSAK